MTDEQIAAACARWLLRLAIRAHLENSDAQ